MAVSALVAGMVVCADVQPASAFEHSPAALLSGDESEGIGGASPAQAQDDLVVFAGADEVGAAGLDANAIGADNGNAADLDASGVVGAEDGLVSVDRMRQYILDQTNQYRSSKNLAPLQMNSDMNDVAQAWSKHQGAARTMSHNPDYAEQIPSDWTRAGENVAAGYTYLAVTAAWFASPGHRANMLGDFTHIGIGAARGVDGRIYYTQNFGKYDGAMPGDEEPASDDSPFGDMWRGAPFFTEINWMFESGLSTGVRTPSGPRYQPKNTVSREAMAAFLYRLNTPDGAKGPAGYTVPKVSPFADVATGHQFFKEIAWMAEEGISTGIAQPGGKPKFAPKDGVSREAMAAFMYRLEGDGAEPTGQRYFADVPRSHKFYRQITWMYASGLSTGSKQASGLPTYNPSTRVTREAMAAFLYRAEH